MHTGGGTMAADSAMSLRTCKVLTPAKTPATTTTTTTTATAATGRAASLESLRTKLATAIARIREGRGFAATLAECGLTTPVARHMLTVGERAGNLGEMLAGAARAGNPAA